MQKLRIDMTGRRYGELLCVGFSHLDSKKNAHWQVRCSCGIEKTVNGSDLRAGKIISCGHLKRLKGAENQLRHGNATRLSKSATYRTWRAMLTRCYYERSERFKNYGGRGITVCASWKDSFEAFLRDMGEKPCGLTIERIDVDGNYEPSNCRWATWEEQRKNTTKSRTRG